MIHVIPLPLPKMPDTQSITPAPGPLYQGTEMSLLWFDELGSGPVDDAT